MRRGSNISQGSVATCLAVVVSLMTTLLSVYQQITQHCAVKMCQVTLTTLIRGNLSSEAQHLIFLLREVISSEAALFNFYHSFLSSAVLLSATYFLFIRSLSRCILFLPRVACPFILPLIISCNNDSCLSTRCNHICLHFPTVSNIVLVSFTLRRTSSLLILSHTVK